MADENTQDLDNTDIEAPGDTQATHSAGGGAGSRASRPRGTRKRVAEGVDHLGDSLERRALEMELRGGVRAKAAPAIRRVSRAADVSAEYVRENSVGEMKDDLEGEIREHPLRSMAIALVGGYLLAKILD